MRHRPLLDQARRRLWKMSLDHFASLDRDVGFVLAIYSLEMRRRMIEEYIRIAMP